MFVDELAVSYPVAGVRWKRGTTSCPTARNSLLYTCIAQSLEHRDPGASDHAGPPAAPGARGEKGERGEPGIPGVRGEKGAGPGSETKTLPAVYTHARAERTCYQLNITARSHST